MTINIWLIDYVNENEPDAAANKEAAFNLAQDYITDCFGENTEAMESFLEELKTSYEENGDSFGVTDVLYVRKILCHI